MGILDIKIGIKIPATVLQISAYWELEHNGIIEDLEFNKETHIFTVKGQPIPSVTWILRQMELTPNYSFFDNFYATRGRYVHLATELFDNNILDEDTLDDEILPYFEQYKKAREQFTFEIIGVEVRKRHPIYFYAGIIDRLISGNKSYVLYLTKENFRLEEVKSLRQNLNVFLSALNLYVWRKQYQIVE